MDITWVTDRIAVGGGIWNSGNMAKVAEAGITHIIDMQIEFDDTPLGLEHGIEVLWNPTDDDFERKPPGLFRRGVEFAQRALEGEDGKVFIHCAAGVHRAPMMALAVLGSMGWKVDEAQELIEEKRPVADFADVYVKSVESLFGGKSGSEKKDAAMSFLENALTTVDAVAAREIVDPAKFKEGISKIIDGTVECLNASTWAKSGAAGSVQQTPAR